MILDSNLVIYMFQARYAALRRFIESAAPAVSAVSVVEVLGFHKLGPAQRLEFEHFFASAEVLPVTEPVIARAVALRQDRKMSLGDALIAATALVNGRALLTHNLADFAWVAGLGASDPLAPGGPAAP